MTPSNGVYANCWPRAANSFQPRSSWRKCASSSIRLRQLAEVRIADQFLVGADPGDLAVAKMDQPIAVLHRGHAMRDCDHRTSTVHGSNGSGHFALGLTVERGGRLVEE